MKHRDRVLMALSHETPDRCPMQISFTPEFASLLTKDMKMGNDKLHNPHGGGNTYELERALNEDLLLTSVGWANSYYQEENNYVDEWGIGWRSAEYTTPYGVGRYTEINHHHWQTEQGQKLIQMLPRKRVGQPQDLDGLLLMLASDQSHFINGAVIAADDGFGV